MLLAGSISPLTASPAIAAAPARQVFPTTVTVQAAAATAQTPAAAVASAVAYAAGRGVHAAVAIADRSTGAILASWDPDEQFASASLVKLYTAVYYGVRNPTLIPSLSDMIRVSRDQTQSALWNPSIVPTVAARYGLTGSSNTSAGNAGYWGTVQLTARDMVRFQYRMERDPAVSGFLPQAMREAADHGADGFDQNFGVNALSGTGSKQGWTSIAHYPSNSVYGLHSVGFTSKYYLAILQTASRSTGYQTMRETATHAAWLLAASSVVRPPPYPVIPRASAIQYVASLYAHLLGRTGSSARFVDALVRGQWSVAMVAQAVIGSSEQYAKLADLYYRGCLLRSGNPAYGARLATIPLATGLQEICAGTEAWNTAGKSADRYLRRVLGMVWQQSPSGADLSRFRSILTRYGRASVITNATLDPRFRRQAISTIYHRLLFRSPEPTALTKFPKANVRFQGIEQIFLSVATSSEYWNKWAR